MSSACQLLEQPSSDTNASQTLLWRPWLSSSRDKPERGLRSKLSSPYSRPTVLGCSSSDGKGPSFQHPVRLFWSKSKSFDYLYSDGEALLRNFPIQATISFYDECYSEDENDDDWEDSSDDCLKQMSHFTSYN